MIKNKNDLKKIEGVLNSRNESMIQVDWSGDQEFVHWKNEDGSITLIPRDEFLANGGKIIHFSDGDYKEWSDEAKERDQLHRKKA